MPVETNQKRGGGGICVLYIFVVLNFFINQFLMYFVKVSMYDRWGAGGLGWALTTVRGHTALNFLLLDIASERKE